MWYFGSKYSPKTENAYLNEDDRIRRQEKRKKSLDSKQKLLEKQIKQEMINENEDQAFDVSTTTNSSPTEKMIQKKFSAPSTSTSAQLMLWKETNSNLWTGEFKRFDLSKRKTRKMKSKVRKFYEHQNKIVEEFEQVDRLHEQFFESLSPQTTEFQRHIFLQKEYPSLFPPINTNGNHKKQNSAGYQNPRSKFAVRISFACNIMLFLLKLGAALISQSLSMLASTFDSAIDVFSGLILMITSRMRYKETRGDYYKYPAGKTRYELLGSLIFACIVCTTSLVIMKDGIIELTTNSISRITNLFGFSIFPENGNPSDNTESLWNIRRIIPLVAGLFVVSTTILVKTALFFICFFARNQSSAVRAYMLDHRNDIFTNSLLFMTLILSFFLERWFWWVDPTFATILSFLIALGWMRELRKSVRKLVGSSANADFLAKLTYLTITHNAAIMRVETVRAFHFGEGLIAEVHIVLPLEMSLKDSHGIGESLQQKIECLVEVERAFVHLDYENEHKEGVEHQRAT